MLHRITEHLIAGRRILEVQTRSGKQDFTQGLIHTLWKWNKYIHSVARTPSFMYSYGFILFKLTTIVFNMQRKHKHEALTETT